MTYRKALSGLIFLFLFLVLVRVQAQDKVDVKTEKCFKGINVNYSFVNIGTIHHWHVPTNIDETRPYMHYTLGVEGRFNKWIALRFDYFSNYANGF